MKKNLLTVLALFVATFLVFFAIGKKTDAEAPIFDPVPSEIRVDPVKLYAFQQVFDKWGSQEWNSFYQIIKAESDWDSNAQNSHSSAYGLGQLLNGTRKDLGLKKTSDPFLQVDETVAYIADRYGDPDKAWDFWKIDKWY